MADLALPHDTHTLSLSLSLSLSLPLSLPPSLSLSGKTTRRLSPLQRLVKEISDQTQKVRDAIQERDQLERCGQLRSMQGIAAASAVRRELKDLAGLADRLHAMYLQAEKAVEGGDESGLQRWRAANVDGLLQHVQQCIATERSRGKMDEKTVSQASKASADIRASLRKVTGQGVGGGGEAGERVRAAGATGSARAAGRDAGRRGLGGRAGGEGAEDRIERGEQGLEEQLLRVGERECEIDEELDAVFAGLSRLRGIAVDINTEVLQRGRLKRGEGRERAKMKYACVNIAVRRFRFVQHDMIRSLWACMCACACVCEHSHAHACAGGRSDGDDRRDHGADECCGRGPCQHESQAS